MKLRYTPFQVKVLSVEEEEHPQNLLYQSVDDLGGMPVVVGTLHSMLTPAAATFKYVAGIERRLVYLMTDGAALPLWFSKQVDVLKSKTMIDATITCGHSFGGDYEAINIYSGLLCAKAIGADATVVLMGPGIVGSSTKYGNTALEQGEIINAVNILGGQAIAIPRISFSDSRDRHRGLSHHTRTALGEITLTPSVVPIPIWNSDKREILLQQMADSDIQRRHQVVEIDTSILPTALSFFDLTVNTMGRSYEEDPEFFHSAGASGIFTAGLVKAGLNQLTNCGARRDLIAQENNEVRDSARKVNGMLGAV